MKDFYYWCKEDVFVEITEEMLEAMKAADRQESAYKRRTIKQAGVWTHAPAGWSPPAGGVPPRRAHGTLCREAESVRVGHILQEVYDPSPVSHLQIKIIGSLCTLSLLLL